ncbi:MAG: N-acetyltransferase [DPANN group archaeon]|nr:N-acetyltransferase [DPANN group archaeon]
MHATAQVHQNVRLGENTKVFQNALIHEGADIGSSCIIGKDVEIEAASISDKTRIWNQSHVRKEAKIGSNCNIGKNVFVGGGVVIGNNCKVENNVNIYEGVVLEDGVFLGPSCTTTNDLAPRSINPDGSLKGPQDWVMSKTLIKRGASVGAKAVILPVTIGEFALVGAGATVTKDVPAFGLVVGTPARLAGYVCKCARKLETKCDECGVKLSEVELQE